MRLGYLGPEGTFSEQAAMLYEPKADFVRYPSIRSVAEAVDAREIDEGIVPIENSLHGSVIDVLDFLIRTCPAREGHSRTHLGTQVQWHTGGDRPGGEIVLPWVVWTSF